MNSFFNIDSKIAAAAEKALEAASASFARIDEIRAYNQEKVLAAFIKNSVTESHFTESTGYGYGDRGRDVLDSVLADCVGAEDSLIRHSLTCGTHTLGVALFGLLRPGDTMLCVTGTPYDTIHSVIGIKGSGMGSLKDFGVTYKQVDLQPDGTVDLEGIEKALEEKVAMVYIQRSRGYSLRPSLGVEDIEKIAKIVRNKSDAVIMVDNCYGEFVERTEPVSHGADIIAGSLIKNPGGGIAKCGGYIAGRADLVEKCSYRMTTPGLGREVGPSLGQTRGLFMGLFNAPHIVGEALKTAVFAASLFEQLGYETTPHSSEKRVDIIQALKLCNSETLTGQDKDSGCRLFQDLEEGVLGFRGQQVGPIEDKDLEGALAGTDEALAAQLADILDLMVFVRRDIVKEDVGMGSGSCLQTGGTVATGLVLPGAA